jgi:superfamily II DNA or RNA helicase
VIETRDYQTRIVERAIQAIDEGHRHILIESPTGSGKTVIGHLIAKALHERHGWRSGWTAMRRHLLHQAAEMNREMIGFEHVRYFSTFDSDPPTGIDLLIDDEAQHSASETATDLYNRLQPKAVIGLSATPFRTDRLKLCYSKTIRDAGIRALIDQKWLSPFHQYVFDEEWTPANVAKVYLKEPARWGKSVMYFLTLNECDQCAQILQTGGVRCEVVHGASDQSAQIESFRQGNLDVLLNVIVLTEGFDCADLKTVFVRPGSRGPTMQMVGRALRKHPEKLHAQVVQNNRTSWPFTKIASAEAKFVLADGMWVSRISVTEKMTHAQTNTLLAIAQIPVRLPPKLLRRPKRRRAPLPGNPA